VVAVFITLWVSGRCLLYIWIQLIHFQFSCIELCFILSYSILYFFILTYSILFCSILTY